MTALVIRRKLRSVVLLLVEETQRDKPPIDLVPCLGRHFGNPAGCDPGKGADRVPEEFDVIVTHTLPFLSACRPRLCDTLAVLYQQTCRRIVPYPPPPSTDTLPSPPASGTMGAMLMVR